MADDGGRHAHRAEARQPDPRARQGVAATGGAVSGRHADDAGAARLLAARRPGAPAVLRPARSRRDDHLSTEARADFLQGHRDSARRAERRAKAEGYTAFRRYACKMATGAGKTTVMGMLAAWSILNKVDDRSDARFSDVVLVVCPNVTIRSRLARAGSATRARRASTARATWCPPHLMPELAQGRVLVTNWHVFEPQSVQAGGVSARVVEGRAAAGRCARSSTSAPKTTTARGRRYLTPDELDAPGAPGCIDVLDEERDETGNLKRVEVESANATSRATRAREPRARPRGRRQAEHPGAQRRGAPRLPHPARRAGRGRGRASRRGGRGRGVLQGGDGLGRGLDRIHKLRGINFCVDLSATPYFLGRVGPGHQPAFPMGGERLRADRRHRVGPGEDPAARGARHTGAEIPGYFNIWRWILPQAHASRARAAERVRRSPRRS